MSANESNSPVEHSLAPNPDLRALDRLVGTWQVSGGAQGTIVYEWMEGGFFLMQQIDLEQYGQKIKGIEIIGHLRFFGEEPGTEIQTRYYDSLGNTFDYVYEMEGETFTIWAGAKGSPAYYKGAFSPDGNSLTGSWTYPDGGGYDSLATRLKG
jgi:hypothetical protein